MPNYITNRLTIMGSDKDVLAVKDFLKGEERFIDFNTIFKMPAELHGSYEHGAIEAARFSLQVQGLFDDAPPKSLREYPSEFDDERWDTYIKCLQNYRNHKFLYWYDWALTHWGVKWNASDQKMEDDNVIVFATPWEGVPRMILEISKRFPCVEFKYEYASEDTSFGCGYGRYHNGIEKLTTLEGDTKEAYDFAFTLNPHQKEDYKLVNGNYEYINEE